MSHKLHQEHSYKLEKCEGFDEDLFYGRLIVMADARGEDEEKNEKFVRRIMEKVIKFHPQPNYIVFVGDLVLGSKKPHRVKERLEYFKQVIKEYYPIEFFLPAVGNHELNYDAQDREITFSRVFSEFKATNFLEGYNRTVYYLDFHNTRLIVLNPYHSGENSQITKAQLEWFKYISAQPKMHKIVFIHTPPFPTGHHLDSSLDVYTEKRNLFWDVVDKNKIDMVFCGHEHNYSRREINKSFNHKNFNFISSVMQIVSGGAGGSLNNTYKDRRGVVTPPIPKHHYVIVDIYEKIINLTAITLDGKIIDKFLLKK